MYFLVLFNNVACLLHNVVLCLLRTHLFHSPPTMQLLSIFRLFRVCKLCYVSVIWEVYKWPRLLRPSSKSLIQQLWGETRKSYSKNNKEQLQNKEKQKTLKMILICLKYNLWSLCTGFPGYTFYFSQNIIICFKKSSSNKGQCK